MQSAAWQKRTKVNDERDYLGEGTKHKRTTLFMYCTIGGWKAM